MQPLTIRASHRRGVRRRLPVTIVLILLGTIAADVSAQSIAHGFVATARVDSAYYRGDTLHIAHSATVSKSSSFPLLGFVVETPRQSVQRRPPGRHWLLHYGDFAGIPAAQWFAVGAPTAPASTSPTYDIGALGVADLVSFWLVAETPVPKMEDPDADTGDDQMLQPSVVGTTVGIVPLPASSSSAALANRLRSLLARSCGDLGWIGAPSQVASSMRIAYSARTAANAKINLMRNPRVMAAADVSSISPACTALDAKLVAARKAFVAGQPGIARDQLIAFTTSLDAMRAPTSTVQVNGAAYALLTSNVTYLLKHL
jgi:hypothetical protein